MIEICKLSDDDLISCAILLENGKREQGIDRLLTYIPESLNYERLKINKKTFLQYAYPTVFNIIKREKLKFSLSEMVQFINLSRFRVIKDTTLKSWVSNGEFKNFIGSPKLGRKYSLIQLLKLFLIHDLRQVIEDYQMGKYLKMISCVEDTVNQWMPVYLQVAEMNYYTTLILRNNVQCTKEYSFSNLKVSNSINNSLRKINERINKSKNSQLVEIYENLKTEQYPMVKYLEQKLDRLRKIENDIQELKKNNYEIEIRKLSDWIFTFNNNISFDKLSMDLNEKIKQHRYNCLSMLPNYEILTELLPVLETGNYINIIKSEVLNKM